MCVARGLLVLALVGCHKVEPEPEPDPDQEAVLGVDQTDTWTIPGLHHQAHVLNGPMGIPWIYAEDREDLGRVLGFVLGRDRFFYMDLARRLAQGETAALLGADALTTDIESRMTGMTAITDRSLALIEADPEMGLYFAAVAAGINASIEAVKAGRIPAPTEYELAAPLLGKASAVDVMQPFDTRDVVAGMVTVLYESGFETKDVGRSADALAARTAFAGADEQALREAGWAGDIWDHAEPVYAVASAPDWPGADGGIVRRSRTVPTVEPGALNRLKDHLDRVEKRLGHDWQEGFGSNAWAVSSDLSADGRAMVAADGHLGLSTPTLFYQLGLDTRTLGGDGGLRQVGMVLPALPLLAVGTNGDVAFGQTQLMGDITDWYREVITLDGAGAPASVLFQGAQVALVPITETFETASVPILGSAASTVTLTRYTTADGRFVTSIEGRPVGGPEEAGTGETAINLMGDWVVPGDADGDGTITGISFDYAGLDLSNMAGAIDRYTRSTDVQAFGEATRDLVAYSLNLVAADSSGSILYTGYQAVPCRGYLKRLPSGAWEDGADPNLLLDGTQYGGFTIPITDGRVDTSQGSDPQRCVIPWEEYPHSINPDQGFVVSANNDPGGLTFDGSLTDDPVYIGGPWTEGYRAWRIQRDLQAWSADGMTVQEMKDIQGDHRSNIGEQLLPELVRALDAVADASVPSGDESLDRAVALWAADSTRLHDAFLRLSAWADRGMVAESGVETFYNPVEGSEREDAVATTIYNAWMGRYVGRVVDDEGIPGLGWPTGDTGKLRLMTQVIEGRGPSNPLGLASFNDATGESIWFDDRRTPGVIETSVEDAILSLGEALDFLESAPTGPAQGGFGTPDMDQWLWGLRHTTRFPSLLGDFFDADDPLLGSLIAPLDISPDDLPLAEGLLSTDPRSELEAFPRPGDHLGIDAANSGTNGSSFGFGSGSVYRWVAALGGSGFEAYNILPGGQSGIADTEHFADQAALWLGNAYVQVPIEPAKVAAVSVGREVFEPE